MRQPLPARLILRPVILRKTSILLLTMLISSAVWLLFHTQITAADVARSARSGQLVDSSQLTATHFISSTQTPPLALTADEDPFTLAWSSAESGQTRSIAWGDYDGDGDLDLAVGFNDQPNRLYRNDSGTLVAIWSSAENDQTQSVAWGDVDGDGDLDLAVGNANHFPNRLYRNEGGMLTTSAVWSSTDELNDARSVAWGDVDGDGDLDLAVANYSVPNRLYRNEGGMLTTSAVWSADYAHNTRSVAWGDVDNDGDLDLAVGNFYLGDNAQLYRNDYGLLTSSAIWSSIDQNTRAATSVAWGDVDNDGDLDLAVGSTAQNRLYRNDNGVLTSSAVWLSTESDLTNSVAWGDADSDGDLDLAAGNYGQPNRLYRNDNGTLTPNAVWSSTLIDSSSSVAWGDTDNDGDLDLAIGNFGPPTRLYRNNNGVLRTSSSAIGSGVGYVAWGDIDNDGDFDLAVGNGTNGCNPIFLYGNDNGGWTSEPVWSSTESNCTFSMAWGDVDNDGDLDLAVGNGGAITEQPNRLYRNDNGMLMPSAIWSSTESEQTHSVAWGDVDNDGDLDLAAGNTGQTRLYRNANGALTSGAVWSSTQANWARSVAWGDVDGDGDLDLAVGNSYQPNRLYRNDNGMFADEPVWSSSETADTRSVAWGDVDGDGDLDLAVGNSYQPNRLYRNNNGTLTSSAAWSSSEADGTNSLAWGDVDNDGDLDLAVGNYQQSRVYRNDSGVLTPSAVWSSERSTTNVAWGDMDNDGDLDLAVGGSHLLYLNARDRRTVLGSVPSLQVIYPYANADYYSSPQVTSGVIPITYTLRDPQGDSVEFIHAWYSPDGGGKWYTATAASDVVTTHLSAVASMTQTFIDTTSTPIFDLTTITSTLTLSSTDIIADIDVYLNLTHTYNSNLVITLTAPFSRSVLLIRQRGSDGDDFIDTVFDDETSTSIVSGTVPFTGRYRPEQTLSRLDGYSSRGVWTLSIADVVDGDTGTLLSWGMTVTLNSGRVYTYLWDVGGSGFFGQSDNVVFRIQAVPAIITGTQNAIPGPYLYGAYASQTFPFRVRGTQVQVLSNTQLISSALVYRLPSDQSGGGELMTDAAGTPFHTNNQGYLQGRGQINLGDRLLALLPILSHINYAGTLAFDGVDDYVIKNPFVSTPITETTVSLWLRSTDTNEQGTPLSYATISNADEFLITNYNNLAIYRGSLGVTTGITATDGLWHHLAVTWRSADGQVKVYKDGLAVYTSTLAATSIITGGSLVLGQDQDSVGGGFHSAHAFKGDLDQVHVWNKVLDETQIQNDMLGLMSSHEPGLLLAWDFDASSQQTAFDASGNGNDGTLNGATWNGRSLGGYTVYNTNGTPTEIGLDAFTVTQPGVQTLVVTTTHPLILFDLDVALEWDAHNQPIYLQQLDADLKKASAYLYDFTNGQAALGHVTVHQNADDWLSSQVVVYATNRLRPLAVQGGLVTFPISDPQHSAIVYSPGQVRMGAVWNRYGEPGGDVSDWPLALAHELSHYLLYQEDTYLGLNQDGLLIPVDTCAGSVMGDMYNPDNTEFIDDPAQWQAGCASTLASRTLGRTEWDTNRLWYPWFVTPTIPNTGPALMPYDFTTVTIADPVSPTNALADPTFYIFYQGSGAASSAARAFLLRGSDDQAYVIDLGSPQGGQNRVTARGAQPGDRLCVFDQSQRQYGCEIITLGDDQLDLEQDNTWTPVLQIRPATSQTLVLEVSGLAGTLPLKAQLFPESGYGTVPITLALSGGVYSGTIELPFAAMLGHLQVWVDEPSSEFNPRRETIVAFTVSGNPGNGPALRGGWPALRGGWPALRGGWPALRGGWPALRGGWPGARGSSAPLVSPGGQLIFFTESPAAFASGELYTIQNMASLPPLPTGKKALGQGYSLIASPNVTRVITGSISFQYMSIDVLVEQADENQLTIYFWDGQAWRALDTIRSPYFNLASAASQGPGVYALLAGVTTPHLETLDPPTAVNDVTTTLTLNGHDFLPPVDVWLIGPTTTYTLPVLSTSPITITALVTAGLPANEYQIRVVNRYDAPSPTSLPFALYAAAQACFYDFFESGSGKWQRSGTWDIISLPNNVHAMTDSPAGNYSNAISPAITATTAITTAEFSLNNCALPALTFRHDYVLAHVGASQDAGQVEISTDHGATWTSLASYTGGGPYNMRTSGAPQIQSDEWLDAQWQPVEIDLSAYTGTVRLRFSLTVDRYISDRGWVIDDVLVAAGHVITEPPIANFTASPTSGLKPLGVNFADTSTGTITTRTWAFGDGDTSSDQNPTHQYSSAGVFTVALQVSGPSGSSFLTRTNYITVSEPPPIASFTANPTNGLKPLTVVFTDTSTGAITSWAWTFGDGNTSAMQNSPHQYTAAGVYTVGLQVSGPDGTSFLTRTNFITVTESPPVVDFAASPTSGLKPLTVVFTDASTGAITSWLWNFGDGLTSTLQSPTHTYHVADNYGVTLTVTGPGGSNSLFKPELITVRDLYKVYLPVVRRDTSVSGRLLMRRR